MTSKTEKKTVEKRLRPFHHSCSFDVQQRIDRARTQKLFLIRNDQVDPSKAEYKSSFVVLGSTGNVYTVTIQHLPSCTCPDYAKGHVCKHILFVLLKVMALDPHSHLIYQTAWTTEELATMFAQMKSRFGQVSGNVLAKESVRTKFAQLQDSQEQETGVARQATEEGDDCPICFDALGTSNTTYCRSQCGANFHQDCIRHWLQQNRSNPTCPMCRQPWEDKNTKKRNKEGFTNLGHLQGQPRERDTSTYSWSKRRRYYYDSDDDSDFDSEGD